MNDTQGMAAGNSRSSRPGGSLSIVCACPRATLAVHWPPGGSSDAGCRAGGCERDDYLTIALP